MSKSILKYGFNHILIVKHGALGDVVRTSYFTTMLRKKHGDDLRLSWITAPSSLPLIRFNYLIDDIWTSFEECQNYEYDHIYSLDDEDYIVKAVSNLKYTYITGAVVDKNGAITYTEDSAEWFDMGLLSNFGKEKADELKKFNAKSHATIFMNILGVDYPEPHFWGSNRYDEWLAGHFSCIHKTIGINPRAGGRWASKELAPDQTELLCNILLNQCLGTNDRLVLIGAFQDHTKNLVLAQKIGDPRIWAPNTDDSVLRLASVIAALDYLISSDSLSLHLGIAHKIPFTAFFAPTSAAEIDDFGLGVKIMSTSSDYCTYRKNADNSSITAMRIFEAAKMHRGDIFCNNN